MEKCTIKAIFNTHGQGSTCLSFHDLDMRFNQVHNCTCEKCVDQCPWKNPFVHHVHSYLKHINKYYRH